MAFPTRSGIAALIFIFLRFASCYKDPFAVKTCGILYSDDNLGGEQLVMVHQAHMLDIAQDQPLAAAFNRTSSMKIENGCHMNLCNETYLTGNCKKLNQGPYNSIQMSTQLGFIAESAECNCDQECKCSDIVMKKASCARAYIDNSCNVCGTFYTDISNVSDSLNTEFVGKVKALTLRKGCNITLYSGEDFDGDSVTISSNVEDNKNSFSSYECTCDDREYKPEPRPPRSPSLPAQVDVPANIKDIADMLNTNHPDHPGLMAALKSRKHGRSSKNAYILLLGSTGSGKSTTINLLFDHPNITKVGDSTSTTTDIHEFRIRIPVDELGLANTELRVIDTPGMGDTRGLEQDAKYLATLDEYLSTHEELKDRKPNAVLIFHKFNDNRFEGTGANFVKMLRGLDAFRERITDENYSNVIFVLTHYCQGNKRELRNPSAKIQQFKDVIENYSLLPRPTIITVAENKGYENDLLMVNGYYKLPNSEYYPRNLFEKLELITKNGRDDIGLGVFRTAFRNSDDFAITPSTFQLLTGTGPKVTHYLRIIINANYGVVKTDISELLNQVWENDIPNDLKRKFPDSINYLQKSLYMLNVNSREDIPKTQPEIVKLISAIKHDPATRLLIEKGLKIEPPKFSHCPIAGYSFNIFQDNNLPISPFADGDYKQSDIGFLVPDFLTCKLEQSSDQHFIIFDDEDAYIQHRLGSLGIQGRIPRENFKGGAKPGYNIKQMSFSNGTTTLSATREFKFFQFILNNKPTLKPDFEVEVKALPIYNASDKDAVDKWTAFFNKYGTHVVKSVHGGGAIEIHIRNKGPLSPDIGEALFDLIKFAEDITYLVGNPNQTRVNSRRKRSILKQGIDHTLVFRGGDKQYYANDFTKMSVEEAVDKMTKWKKSLRYNPEVFPTDMTILPISHVVKQVRPSYAQEVDKVSSILFDANLIFTPPPKHNPIPPPRPDTDIMTAFLKQIEKSNDRLMEFLKSSKEMERKAEERRQELEKQRQEFERERQRLQEEHAIKTQEAQHLAEAERRKLEAKLEEERQKAQAIRDEKQQKYFEEMMKANKEAMDRHYKSLQEISNRPQPKGASCLKKGTKILMMDGSEKPVELMQVGDIVVDKDGLPATVLGVSYELLLDQNFYGFDDNSYFFTDSHLFVGPSDDGENLKIFAKSTELLYYNSPLLKYLNVSNMDESFKLFHVDNISKELSVQDVKVSEEVQKYPRDTRVYFIQVNSSTATYVANGYVCRHETPSFEFWPNTMSILFRLMGTESFGKLAQLPYTVETMYYLKNSTNKVAETAQRFLESYTIENMESAEEVQQVMTLGDVDLNESVRMIFSSPTLSSAGINFYARVGEVIAAYLDVGFEIPLSDMAKLQHGLYLILSQEMQKYLQ